MTFTESTFQTEVLSDPGVVLIDIWTAWCGPCRAVSPIIDKLAKDVPDVKVGKLNMDENYDLCLELGVSALPTMLFYKGGKLAKKLVGLQSEAVLRKTLEELKR